MNYNNNFRDNIYPEVFDNTSLGILNWIKENRDKFDFAKDPNAYEMTNLFLFGGKYSSEGKEINTDTLSQMWDIRSKDFKSCNIPNNNFVYAICQDSYEAAISGIALVNDENSHHALKKMAGIGLFLKQQQRDKGTINYNNPQELLELLRASKSLKTFHPDLFGKYAFEENINTLCDLQLQNHLPDSVSKTIKDAQANVFEDLSVNRKSPDNPSYPDELEN